MAAALFASLSILQNNSVQAKGYSTGFAAPEPTLYRLQTEEVTYLGNTHHYAVSTDSSQGTHYLYINGTKYYFTPNANDKTIVNLANSGAAALIAGTAEDYVYTDGTNYWKYDTTKLATSSYTWKTGGASKSQKNVLEKVDAIHERLDKVMIENRDFETLIKQYDFEDAFFYCDLPYSQGCGYDVTTTKDFDHERLRKIL